MKNEQEGSESPKKDNPSGKGRPAYDKAKSFFGRLFNKPGNGGERDPVKRDPLKELLDRVERSKKHLDPALVPEEVQTDFHEKVCQMAVQGFSEGVIGRQSGSNRLMAEAKTADLYIQCLGSLSKKEESLSLEITAQARVIADKRKQMDMHYDYQNYLQHHNKFNERGSTLGEFGLYIGCALVIFLADIPLATEMLRWLINPPFVGDKPFSIFDPQPADVNPLIMAAGLGISTIYIKVCYDKFVAKKYGHDVMSKKKFEELFIKHADEQAEDEQDQYAHIYTPGRATQFYSVLTGPEKDKIEKNERTIRKIEIGLLAFTLSTIALLGVFRGYARKAIINPDNEIPVELTSLTLIFLTLLFTIVTGVCLSIALNALTTFTRLRRCKSEAAALENSFTDRTKNLAEMIGKRAYVRNVRASVADIRIWTRSVYNLLLSYYEMGFSEGHASPGYYMAGLDFFDRLLLWREEIIARRINNHVN